MSDLKCFGHRGAAGYEPENTIASVKCGVDLGADWIEIDVHAVSGNLAVIHDESLEKTTNGSGLVKRRSWEYLKSLDAGKGQKIPSLAEVIDCVDRKAGITIEIKNHDAASLVVSEIHKAIFFKGWNYKQFIVSSYNYLELQLVQCYDPHIRIAIIQSGIPVEYPKFAEQIGAYAIFADKSSVTPEYVDEAHVRGLKMFVFSINHENEFLLMEAMAVDGVVSDFPDKIIAWRFLKCSESSLLSLA